MRSRESNLNPIFDVESLHRLAIGLMIFMLILIPLQIVVFVLFPPPDSVVGYFELFQNNWFVGLLDLDFIYIINNAMAYTLNLLQMSITQKKSMLVNALLNCYQVFEIRNFQNL
jgi:hypothetical protein